MRKDWPGQVPRDQVLANFKPEHWKSSSYRELVRAIGRCAVPRCTCDQRYLQAHHLCFGKAMGKGGRSFGRKANDAWIVPLCNTHHTELTRYIQSKSGVAEPQWWATHAMDAEALAKRLKAQAPDTEAMKRVLAAFHTQAVEVMRAAKRRETLERMTTKLNRMIALRRRDE